MNWIPRDREAARSVMAELEAAGLIVAHPDRRFEPPTHTPSGPPAIFTAWRMVRSDVRQLYLGGGAPERDGGVRIEFWIQPGRGTAALDQEGGLYDVVTAAFAAAGTHLTFFEPWPDEDGSGEAGGANWHIQSLVFPFKAA